MKVLLPTILLLVLSNVFMTFAWYGHLGGGESRWSFLRFVASLKDRPLMLAVFVSWGIAFIEYLFQVPANRIGSESMSKAQLKILQEGIALTVFLIFSILYLKEVPRWTDFAGMGLILAGLAVALLGRVAT